MNAVTIGIVLVVVIGLAGVGLIAERLTSTRSASRTASKTSKKATAGLGILGVGTVAAVLGALDALADVVAQTGGMLLDYPGALAQLALSGLGYSIARGWTDMPATTFAVIAAGVMLVALVLKRG
jgi:hypothetical protein